MIDKVVASADEAVADVADGATLVVGGFGLCGIPENLIAALVRRGVTEPDGRLEQLRRRRLGPGPAPADAADPQDGLLLRRRERRVRAPVPLRRARGRARARRARSPSGCARAAPGIPGFYTPTGVGTLVAEGKETAVFDGRDYVLERGIVGDFSLVAAWKGDRLGNLVYRKAARNFNPMAATAGRISIAEVEELVEVGALDPESVHTPGVFVQRRRRRRRAQKRIERRTVRKG